MARVCSRTSALLAGSSPHLSCASGQAHPSHVKCSARDLNEGRDLQLTRIKSARLGPLPRAEGMTRAVEGGN